MTAVELWPLTAQTLLPSVWRLEGVDKPLECLSAEGDHSTGAPGGRVGRCGEGGLRASQRVGRGQIGRRFGEQFRRGRLARGASRARALQAGDLAIRIEVAAHRARDSIATQIG